MFKIIIKNLNLYGYHGVRDSEKANGQNFRFNIEIFLNKDDLLNSDDLQDTLNYSEAIKIIKEINGNQRFNLLETLSQKIAMRIIKMHPAADKVSVKIEKTSPPINEDIESVGVEYVLYRKNV
jgi:7,8-dihydroneopterin aldolase/epimerase/oxygenase